LALVEVANGFAEITAAPKTKLQSTKNLDQVMMNVVREAIIADDYWPLHKYREMFFLF
jgi:hypothetical protein